MFRRLILSSVDVVREFDYNSLRHSDVSHDRCVIDTLATRTRIRHAAARTCDPYSLGGVTIFLSGGTRELERCPEVAAVDTYFPEAVNDL